MNRLLNKTAIITGAARGQGAETARLFVAEGAKVIIADILDKEGEALAEELGESATYVHLDVSEVSEWANAVSVADKLGQLNVLVNNAGIQIFKGLEDISREEYERLIGINQTGTFLGMQAVIDSMKQAGSGSIINLSSVDGLQAKNGMFAYVASKWAIRGMTKAAALDLGKYGIRVNSVHPGGIFTEMGNPFDMSRDDLNQFYKTKVPLQRVGESREIAYMSLFLASDESSYSTGSEFVADGGWFAGDVM